MFWWTFCFMASTPISPNSPCGSAPWKPIDSLRPVVTGRCSCSPVAIRYYEPPMFCVYIACILPTSSGSSDFLPEKNIKCQLRQTHILYQSCYVSSTYRWTSTAPARRSLKVDKVFHQAEGLGHVTSPRPQRPYQLWRLFEIVINQVNPPLSISCPCETMGSWWWAYFFWRKHLSTTCYIQLIYTCNIDIYAGRTPFSAASCSSFLSMTQQDSRITSALPVHLSTEIKSNVSTYQRNSSGKDFIWTVYKWIIIYSLAPCQKGSLVLLSPPTSSFAATCPSDTS